MILFISMNAFKTVFRQTSKDICYKSEDTGVLKRYERNIDDI